MKQLHALKALGQNSGYPVILFSLIVGLFGAHHLYGRETMTKEDYTYAIAEEIDELEQSACLDERAEHPRDFLQYGFENKVDYLIFRAKKRVEVLNLSNVLQWQKYKAGVDEAVQDLKMACAN